MLYTDCRYLTACQLNFVIYFYIDINIHLCMYVVKQPSRKDIK
mgnify:CR=1 FL=1